MSKHWENGWTLVLGRVVAAVWLLAAPDVWAQNSGTNSDDDQAKEESKDEMESPGDGVPTYSDAFEDLVSEWVEEWLDEEDLASSTEDPTDGTGRVSDATDPTGDGIGSPRVYVGVFRTKYLHVDKVEVREGGIVTGDLAKKNFGREMDFARALVDKDMPGLPEVSGVVEGGYFTAFVEGKPLRQHIEEQADQDARARALDEAEKQILALYERMESLGFVNIDDSQYDNFIVDGDGTLQLIDFDLVAPLGDSRDAPHVRAKRLMNSLRKDLESPDAETGEY